MKPVLRDHSIDIVRGLAIALMVPANLAPVLMEPHGLTLRVLSSFPAPVFVTLSGMMIAFMAARDPKRYDLTHFIRRGLFLLGVGAFVDIAAWGVIPFMGVDVLYLIGISTPLAFLANRLETRWLMAGIGIAIAGSVLLQQVAGYTPYPTEMQLNGTLNYTIPEQTSVLHHWFVDGWFPLLPWFGLMLGGLLLARFRFSGATAHAFDKKTLTISAIICLAGVIIWYLYPGERYSREGFSELFYPPVPGFILCMMGAIPLLLSAIDHTVKFSGWKFLLPFGKASLFFYIIHLLVIARVIVPHWEEVGMEEYLILFAGLAAFLCIISWVLTHLKERFGNKIPHAVRCVVGG